MNSTIKKHLFLSLMAYFLLGFGLGVAEFGIKAGVPLWLTLTLWIASMAFFMTIAFTSLQKVKDYLKAQNQQHDQQYRHTGRV